MSHATLLEALETGGIWSIARGLARNVETYKRRLAEWIGDNLNDYKRDYYVADVAERLNVMERDCDAYGHRFIVLPNPTDGHWVRAIFGESEPAPTDENRRRLRDAAMGISPGR